MDKRCDSALLRLMLDDRLSPEEYKAVEAHVEQCPRCRAELDRMTASAARALLPPPRDEGSSASRLRRISTNALSA